MQIFIVALILWGGLVIPWLTYRTYADVYRWEQAQIAADNAAIVVGREQVKVMSSLRRVQQTLDQLENSHHAAHFSRSVPVLAAVTLPSDHVLEVLIRTTVHSATVAAGAFWNGIRIRASAEMVKQGLAGVVRIPMGLPIRVTHCRLCHLPNGWDLTRGASRLSTATTFGTHKPHQARIELIGDRIRGPWTYQLLDESL